MQQNGVKKMKVKSAVNMKLYLTKKFLHVA